MKPIRAKNYFTIVSIALLCLISFCACYSKKNESNTGDLIGIATLGTGTPESTLIQESILTESKTEPSGIGTKTPESTPIQTGTPREFITESPTTGLQTFPGSTSVPLETSEMPSMTPTGYVDYPSVPPSQKDWVEIKDMFQELDGDWFATYKDVHLKTGDEIEIPVYCVIKSVFTSPKAFSYSYTGFDESIISLKQVNFDDHGIYSMGNFTVKALAEGETTIHIYGFYTPDVEDEHYYMNPQYSRVVIDKYLTIIVRANSEKLK